MQSAASHAQSAHACGLSSVFPEAHVPGKNGFAFSFAACGRQNSAEGLLLRKKLFSHTIPGVFHVKHSGLFYLFHKNRGCMFHVKHG